MLYTAFCDVFAGAMAGEPVYRGTICLNSSPDEELVRIAAECWADYPVMILLRDYYAKEYSEVSVVSYIKKVQ